MAPSNARTSAAIESPEPELSLTRLLDAPPELVFECWTQPQHLQHWQGAPRGFTVTSYDSDIRPGGFFRICMRSPEGVESWLEGGYREIAKPGRLVFTHVWLDANGQPGKESLVTITLADRDGKTELTLLQTGFSSVGSRDGHMYGWNSALDILGDYLLQFIAEERRAITIKRSFRAPRELVFDTWTDSRHVEQWWGPKGFSITTHSMDVRPGGVWRFVMHGPDGVDYHDKITYIEVVRPQRLVYDHGDENSSECFRVTVTFAQLGDRTEITLRSLFPSAAERDFVVEKHNAIEGGNQTMDRFGYQLEKMLADKNNLVITRVFDAPRETVFKAWMDPASLKRWWGPKNFTNPICELDARPGGALRIHMRAPDGTIYPMTGIIHEIVEAERLVFTSYALNSNGDPMFEVLNTITFADEGGKTKLTLRATASNLTSEAAQHVAGMEQGWSETLDRLAKEVKQ